MPFNCIMQCQLIVPHKLACLQTYSMFGILAMPLLCPGGQWALGLWHTIATCTAVNNLDSLSKNATKMLAITAVYAPDIYGYDVEGYDKEGFNVEGYDHMGFDAEVSGGVMTHGSWLLS